MDRIAITVRTVLHLAVLTLVIKKAWPGELLETPLGQLTLGSLLFGVLQVLVGFVIGSFVVLRMIAIPDKEKRDKEWRGGWIIAPIMIGIFVAFPFFYENGGRHNAAMDWLYMVTASIIGWLVF